MVDGESRGGGGRRFSGLETGLQSESGAGRGRGQRGETAVGLGSETTRAGTCDEIYKYN